MNSKEIESTRIHNVILISFDSLRSDYIAQLKHNDAPNFCMMRDNGVFFKNAIVQAPFTIPSHCSMLTGLYPANSNVRDMHHQLPSDIPSIFNILKNEGILTLSFASTPMLESRRITGIDKELKLSPKKFEKTINQIKGKRFFAFFHSWDTHTPYDTRLPINKPMDLILNLLKTFKIFKDLPGGAKYNDLIDLQIIERIRSMVNEDNPEIIEAIKKGYKRSISIADKFLGHIFKIIQDAGLAEKTLIIIMGDHGDSFNEHNEIHRQADKRYEHGHFLYDNILKVPLIFYTPKNIIKKIYDEQIQLIDIVPTMLEALGINNHIALDGLSFWDALRGKNNVPQREFTFSEVVRESRNVELRCIRSNKTKLIIDYNSGEYELYDLIKDPDEQNNLWPNDPYHEKDLMLNELASFSKIESQKQSIASDAEKKKIEKALQALGYI